MTTTERNPSQPTLGKYDHLATDYERPADHDERMRVAERHALWYLGDAGWAGRIIGAYMYPRYAAENLDLEQGDGE